jgi:hypothetical protein
LAVSAAQPWLLGAVEKRRRSLGEQREQRGRSGLGVSVLRGVLVLRQCGRLLRRHVGVVDEN